MDSLRGNVPWGIIEPGSWVPPADAEKWPRRRDRVVCSQLGWAHRSLQAAQAGEQAVHTGEAPDRGTRGPGSPVGQGGGRAGKQA